MVRDPRYPPRTRALTVLFGEQTLGSVRERPCPVQKVLVLLHPRVPSPPGPGETPETVRVDTVPYSWDETLRSGPSPSEP